MEGKGKKDSLSRLAQFMIIKNFMKLIKYPIILCGDFNLRLDTKNLKIVGDGMSDLIQKYHTNSTRTLYYLKEERYADYLFTSLNVGVKQFEVVKDELSDHAPYYVILYCLHH